jgi:hypothetical protein
MDKLFGVASGTSVWEKKKKRGLTQKLKKDSHWMADQLIVVKKLWKQSGAKDWMAQ